MFFYMTINYSAYIVYAYKNPFIEIKLLKKSGLQFKNNKANQNFYDHSSDLLFFLLYNRVVML